MGASACGAGCSISSTPTPKRHRGRRRQGLPLPKRCRLHRDEHVDRGTSLGSSGRHKSARHRRLATSAAGGPTPRPPPDARAATGRMGQLCAQPELSSWNARPQNRRRGFTKRVLFVARLACASGSPDPVVLAQATRFNRLQRLLGGGNRVVSVVNPAIMRSTRTFWSREARQIHNSLWRHFGRWRPIWEPRSRR